MVALIFEDNENTPSSQLLRCLPCGEDIYFSAGNWLLKDKIEELLGKQKYNHIVVYVDLVMDNPKTVRVYRELLNLRKIRQWEGVKIIPILCIEYFICKALVKYNVLDTRGLDSIIENMILKSSFNSVKPELVGRSHEKTLKKVLLNNKSRCYRNQSDISNPIVGKFYMEDCNCDLKFCYKQCIGLQRIKKALYIYSELPVMKVDKETNLLLNKLGLQVNQVDYEVLQTKIQAQYDDIIKDLNFLDNKAINIIL